MNKYEVAEIKKNFYAESDRLVMNRLLTVIVNPNHEEEPVRYRHITPIFEMNDYESAIYYNTLKQILTYNVGRKLIEYGFPAPAYECGNSQEVLYGIVQSAFMNDMDTERFVRHIVNNYSTEVPYAIIAAHCTYAVFKKNAMDEESDYSQEDYKFIITAICPIEGNESAFAFNFNSDEFINSIDSNLFVNRKPSNGFLYPAFNGRSSDVNNIMYYTKSSKDLDTSFIESVLGCNFIMSPENERDCYHLLFEKLTDEDISYSLVVAMEDIIDDFIEENKRETEPLLIDKHKLYSMFESVFDRVGIDKEKLNSFDVLYDKIIGKKNSLNATNLVNSKIKLETNGLTIRMKSSYSDNISINPNKSVITIRIDGGISINGISL